MKDYYYYFMLNVNSASCAYYYVLFYTVHVTFDNLNRKHIRSCFYLLLTSVSVIGRTLFFEKPHIPVHTRTYVETHSSGVDVRSTTVKGRGK